ncbi:RDD family protein [Aliiglaciecola sp. LCG003]|uniref:RDD family protein n=1 Tax=Aliiglaciecola sp. LCG003 TaxID=3053655 RepID=UPI002572E16A|nr:RDD family protein [Aliiglaciecola sp. LCG003]WJG07765.1 RDD family protein [Aliiglaciecola sp. LCG003]
MQPTDLSVSKNASTGDVSSSEQSRHVSKKQQQKETREVVTPYAFEVSPSLFGTPLASPFRRATALLIDLALVALISDLTGNVLAIFVALLFWVWAKRLEQRKNKPKAVKTLRVAAVVFIIGGVIGIYQQGGFSPSSQDGRKKNDNATNITQGSAQLATAAVLLSGKYLLAVNKLEQNLDDGKCDSRLACWQALGTEFVDDIIAIGLEPEATTEIISQFVEFSEDQLDKQEQAALTKFILGYYEQVLPLESVSEADSPQGKPLPAEELPIDKSVSSLEQKGYSLVKWAKGIIADLGLGFGWAAFYFTAVMGLFKGQTFGKKLLGIKVIKLDGSEPTLWESFGRYGGYGAGIATGLMGFLQIFWDPNRQAIQDKIAETLVIRVGGKEVQRKDSGAAGV